MQKVCFNPIFRAANETRCRYRVMKGSAGSGKSYNIAQDYILKLGDMCYKGANLMAVRKVGDWNRQSTYAELVAAINRIYGSQASRYWEIRQSPLSIKSRITGNEVIFRGLKDEMQAQGVKSVAVANGKITWIWAEEATELNEDDIDILDDRLRGELDNDNLYYQLTLSFNPVSITHWIKSKFFDVHNGMIFTHHSTYLDNMWRDKQLDARMEFYKQTNPEAYRVYGLGEWGLLGGQFFSCWRDSIHVCKPFEIPSTWVRARSMDWGSARPYSVGWYAIDYDGRIYKYRELYGYGGKANVGTKETARQVAEKIASLERDERSLISYAILDSACWASSGTTGPTIAEELNATLFNHSCTMFSPSSKGRKECAEQLQLRLVGEDGKPGIQFFDTCYHTIRTIPVLTHDKRDPEKVDTTGEDHAYDETAYMLMSRPYKPVPPKPKQPQRKYSPDDAPSAWAI